MSSGRHGQGHGKRSHHSSSSRGSRRGTQQSTSQLIESLNTHRINTLTELRRIERVAAECTEEEDQQAFQGPMTSAWTYYVTSHQMLNELRNLTRNYPFSRDALDDAKWRVSNDPESNRSWNYAWLVLIKLKDDQMIDSYATLESAKPEMWGGRIPEAEEAQQLADCLAWEWHEALEQMLRHWENPPTTTGF
ncbi:hypothetical protein LHYA1_G000263 [Lachnellula hyalina]|uniref:Uncharacterized protein n=1 Tax=Lachnellula hyalina TaxID=1316788 RepID=A0A8H8RBD4_9HELO|nr:uncharacterized protein LHYA1_G000263 [Lachnellula hyalina]TVY31029.1 hypothetical protein LHYA1_G000263 [Lachnellula hyalina]